MNLGPCPFCGTEINQGATVCTGCQANYRPRGYSGFVPFMLGMTSFCLVASGFMMIEKATIFGIVILILGMYVGSLFFKWTSKRLWYRRLS